MSDQELIEAMARLWVENGGDAEGITWVWQRIRTAVEQLKQEPTNDR